MKRKAIPSITMLTAAAITALITYFKGAGLQTMIIALLAVIVIFYFIGSVIELILKRFEEQNKSKVSDEGEVIEKEASENAGEAEGLDR